MESDKLRQGFAFPMYSYILQRQIGQ